MGYNFPNAPTVGQAYGNYVWDSEKWQLPKGVTPDRATIYAAPFDALAYNGMQINGSMEVDQEYGGAGASWAAGSAVSKYVIDGFNILKTSATVAFNAQQVASVFPGYLKEIKITITTAQPAIGSDIIVLDNNIEGYRFMRAGWGTPNAQPVSIGMWVKSSVAGTYQIAVVNSAQDTAATGSFTITAANTPQFVTITFPGVTTGTWLTTNGIGARLRVFLALAGFANLAAANLNIFETTGWIFLPGLELPNVSRAPLIMRPFDQELVTCQRYYEIGSALTYWGYSGGPGNYGTTARSFITPKRAVPTITVANLSYGNASNYTQNSVTIDGFDFFMTVPTAGSFWSRFSYIADARL